ncbi:MAG: hypothetical protein JST46_10635 [Bacteroidetes bacterium]|nr:hypothetical protein [Bacteroidota bacterium]
MKKYILVVLASGWLSTSFGQDFQDSVRQDEKEIITAIAAYPSDIRQSILTVSQYTPILIKLQRVQARTSQSFQDLISGQAKEAQEKFYEASRYPDLIKALGTQPLKSGAELSSLLSSYPPAVQQMISDLYPSQAETFRIMANTLEKADETMNRLIKDLPSDVQSDFRRMVSMPEIMSLLTDRIDDVVSLGAAYKENPEKVRKNLADLNAGIKQQSEKDLAEYKEKIQKDPEMQEEMKKMAQNFTDSYSANAEGTMDPRDSLASNNLSQNPVSNYVTPNYNNLNPYPYWLGYPYWYSNPVWIPRPWYYHTGFYLGSGGNPVIIGMPSWYYSGWLFNYGWGYGYGWYRTAYPRYYGFCRDYYRSHNTYVTRSVNMNVYKGFNTNVYNHFRHDRESIPRTNSVPNSRSNVITGSNRRQDIAAPNRFNGAHYNGFHAQQFHQNTWNRGGSWNRGSQMHGGRFGGGGGGRRR